MSMDVRRPVESLLPDLPNEEPWFELKFQLRELEADLGESLGRLRNWKAHLGTKEQATQLWRDLYELYVLADHDAEAHAPRVVQLAQCLRTLAPEAVPEWEEVDAAAQGPDFELPEEVRVCHSLSQAQSRLALHLDEALSTLSHAHQAIQEATDARGPVHSVLEHVLPRATLCQQLLQGPAREHVRSAWQWSVPYWRLMDPEAAAAHDARVARAEVELAAIEAELDGQERDKAD
jgi:hypothetical protein